MIIYKKNKGGKDMGGYLLEVKDITKRFGTVTALKLRL